MKKCVLLILCGFALFGCKENELRERFIRNYYDCKLAADTLQMQVDMYQAKHDSLYEIRHQDLATFDEWKWSVKYLTSAIEHHAKMIDLCAEYIEMADEVKGLFDRDYYKIYEKELREQGRIK